MTEKRFAGEFNNQYSGVYDDGKQLSNFEVVRLLNELHEENMMLKGEVAHYKLILMSLEEQARRLSEIHCVGDKE